MSETRLKLLLVEDNRSDARLVLHELQQAGFDLDTIQVETEDAFRRQLECVPDIILCDFQLPQFNAMTALSMLKECGRDIPFIVVSGSIGEETAVQTMHLGASDYLLKDRLGRLGQAVAQAIKARQFREAERAAARDLRESQEMIHLLLNSTAEAIYGQDLEGKCTFCNPACARMLHFDDPREFLGKNMHQLIHHSYSDGTPYPESSCRIYQGMREGTGTHSDDEVLWRSDGTCFPAEYWSYPVIRDGEKIGGVVTFIDISERKRAEQRLRAQYGVTRVLAASPSLAEASTQILQTICVMLDWDLGGLWRVDTSTQVLRRVQVWHRSSLAVGEFEAATDNLTMVPGVGLPGRVWANQQPVWIPDVLQDAHSLRRESLAKLGLRAAVGFPIKLGTEVLGVLEFFSRQFVEPEEEMLQMMTSIGSQIGQFIERKQVEESLQASQRRMRHIVGSSPAVLYTMTAAAEVPQPTWVSENILDVLGFPAAETLAPNWWLDHVHAEDRHRALHEIKDLVYCDSFSNETRFRNADGEYRWLRNNMRLLRDAAGNPVEIVGSFTDITERKQLEEQFRQAQKMEAIGKLAGGVAHDFNNLLTVIMGYSEIALNSLKPQDPLCAPLKEINRAGDRATGLTRQLLAFSRKQVLQPVVLDLNTVLVGMEKMMERLIGEDVSLTLLQEPNLWRIKADPGQMEQILMNLVVNARDAMPCGGKILIETKNINQDEPYLKTHAQGKAGQYVLMAITDTGTGMDAVVKSRIFEPFFTTKGPAQGTGLGLATVYGIVNQSDGHIEVYSEVGQGTTFKIYLPRDTEGAAVTPSVPNRKPLQGGKETILLVEDEDGVRSLAKAVLIAQGYSIIDARHGGEALLICETHGRPIDLLVTDVVMPHLSGRQLTERLKMIQPALKVLYMSGYTDDAIVRHGVLESGVPFLQKPFTPEGLTRKIREVLDR